MLKDAPEYRALWIDGGVLYGDTDQGVVILWTPDQVWDPAWDL
jgi:hypothetical protein